MTEHVSCCSKLVPLRDKNLFEPCLSNEIVVTFEVFFRKFPTSTPVVFVWESSPTSGLYRVYTQGYKNARRKG